MSPDTFTHKVTAAAPRAPVWEALQEAETWRALARVDGVSDEQHDSEGTLRGFRWYANVAGERWEGTATITEARPREHLRFELGASEIDGAIVIDLADVEGSETQITAMMEVAAVGPLAQMFWGVLRGALARGLEARLEEFANRF